MNRLLPLVLVLGLDGCWPKSSSSGDTPKAASGNHDAAGPITEEKLGVKLYPGAKIVTSGETSEIVSANLQTSDPADKVTKFYEKELGASADASGSIMTKKSDRTFVVSVMAEGSGSVVSIMGKK